MAVDSKHKTSLEMRESHVSHVEGGLDGKLQGTILSEYAQVGAASEHKMGPMEAIKNHYGALFWCLMVSTCVIMEGYDTILIGNFYAFP